VEGEKWACLCVRGEWTNGPLDHRLSLKRGHWWRRRRPHTCRCKRRRSVLGAICTQRSVLGAICTRRTGPSPASSHQCRRSPTAQRTATTHAMPDVHHPQKDSRAGPDARDPPQRNRRWHCAPHQHHCACAGCQHGAHWPAAHSSAPQYPLAHRPRRHRGHWPPTAAAPARANTT
jgi:hypothetical protein